MFKKMMLGMTVCSALVAGCDSNTPATTDLSVALDLSAAKDMTTPADLASNADLAPAVVVTVGMGGLNFNPADVTIKAGQSVKWIWASSGHNVVSGVNGTRDNKFCSPSDAAVCDSTGSPTSSTSATYIHTFNNTGTFPYFCQPHSGSNMKGTVTVQ